MGLKRLAHCTVLITSFAVGFISGLKIPTMDFKKPYMFLIHCMAVCVRWCRVGVPARRESQARLNKSKKAKPIYSEFARARESAAHHLCFGRGSKIGRA